MSLKNVKKFWEWFDEERGKIPIREIGRRAYAPRGRKILQNAGIRVECDDGDIKSIKIASY